MLVLQQKEIGPMVRSIDYDQLGRHEFGGDGRGQSRCLTGADWAAGRKATGVCYGYRWVRPDGENRTKQEWPYSYSDHYLWGSPAEGDTAVYSDRLAQWDRDKWNRAWAAVQRKRFDQLSEKEASAFMSAYEGKPVTVTALAEGCNVSSGYPYWILWFRTKE